MPRYLANRRRFRQYWEQEKQAHPETVAFLHSIQERFHAGGGFAWEAQDFKLFCWNRLLRSELPRFVVEYGSGSSTAISLRYARETGARLVAYEEHPGWFENTRRLLEDTWKEEGELVLAKREIFPDRRPREVRYDVNPLPGVDCVLIDGPTLEFDGDTDYEALRVNLFEYDPLPRLVAVDASFATVRAIRERLGDRYHFRESDFSASSLRTIRGDFEWFHVFRIR